MLKSILSLLLLSSFVFAQQEQAGIELAASFPAFTEGNKEPDLPADGFYWDVNNPGWGLAIEVQQNETSESGYFIFGTIYSYDDDGTPLWCVFSQPYVFNEDVHQWRDAKSFSNLRYGHNDEQIMSEMNDVQCLRLQNGPSINSNLQREPETESTLMMNLLWRTPTILEVTVEGGITHYTSKFAFYGNLSNPSMDWIMETHWAVMSDSISYTSGSLGHSKISSNDNVTTGFERLDEDQHQNLKDFVGHQEDWVYYISTVKSSNIGTIYRDFSTQLTGVFEPDIGIGFSNFSWIVLIHDKTKNRVMLFTVAGDKDPGELRPDAGINIKFVADVNHDADSIDFYAYNCEGLPGNATITGYGENCRMTSDNTWQVSQMADWSPQNVHRASMKMFKLKTGGEGYLFNRNNGESNTAAENRIKDQLIMKGILEE